MSLSERFVHAPLTDNDEEFDKDCLVAILYVMRLHPGHLDFACNNDRVCAATATAT
ncbi:hypothetical protein TIFTF001_029928 [Ficus carica]|uniref:Uncharacterized protein n=1 Tax=Ficus carica TaxID=3494 RepID=A0AA88J3F9_FICCA|nr:hypothetical protein TIFTF001_029928 [Ficus carica]